jgi:sigma-E factor negative regulatory protein RseA
MNITAQSKDATESASWEASVSAWVDGEEAVRVQELDSPYGRHVWDTYHLIGDVLRNGDLAIKPSDRFYARISKAIDDEPAIVAPHARRHAPVRMGLSGLAVAAAVASVVWVALPYFSTSEGGAPQVQVMASANTDVGLRDYLEAHRQITGINPVRQVSFDTGAAQ